MLAHSREELARHVDLLSGREVRLLAEKVETYDEFERCKALGFELFQGFFFCRPKTMTGRSVSSSRLATLRLVAELQAPHVDLDELEHVIGRDVGLSYKLLRYINSTFFALPREVGSVRQALVLLGIVNVRRWATLLALSAVDDKPEELMVTALVRARMCELLAEAYREPDRDAYFTTGMFSVIDALMDQPMAEVLELLPLAGDLRHALLSREGPKGDALLCVLAYERGELDEARHRSLTGAQLGELYLEAVA